MALRLFVAGVFFFCSSLTAHAQWEAIELELNQIPSLQGQLEEVGITYPDSFSSPAGMLFWTEGPAPCADPLQCLGQFQTSYLGGATTLSYLADPDLEGTSLSFFLMGWDGSATLALSALETIQFQQTEVELRDSIEQWGITWTFDGEVPAGQFANGDWWVVGPVTVVQIDPPSLAVGGRTRHGSMINPSPTKGTRQGYDSELYTFGLGIQAYDPSLNVAAGVAGGQPLVVPPHSSLVSTRSVEELGLAQLQTAAVLTVLEEPAPVGSFRPPYSGSDKTPRFLQTQLEGQRDLLGNLPRTPSAPALEEVERKFERVWLDHVPTFYARQHHPRDNMGNYGREISTDVGDGMLLLHSDLTASQKERLLVRMVQLGIDNFGVVEDGGTENWVANGGHGSGRKLPILFAGVMLGDPAMSAIGSREEVQFGEDCQTFFVEETSPGVFNHGIGGYGSDQAGMPEWGYWHCNLEKNQAGDRADNLHWYADAYRLCCTANSWHGAALSLHVMGLQALWGHDAFLAYMDRYVATTASNQDAAFEQSWSPFALEMWNAHRGNFDWSYTWGD